MNREKYLALFKDKRIRNAAIVKMYRGGETMRKLAERFGITVQRVSQIVQTYEQQNDKGVR